MRPDLIAWLTTHGFTTLARVVPTSGAMYAAVFLICGWLLIRRARAIPLLADHAVDIWIAAGLGASVGARIYYLVINGKLWSTPFATWFGHSGTGSWGAYVGASLLVAAYAYARKLPVWPWLDVAASIAPLGEVIGRWACWLAGDDFGKVTTVPWAIHFPQGSLAWQAQVARGELARSATESLAVHPQQFYLMINALLLFIVVSAVWSRNRARSGVTFAAYLLLYGATRFWWEFFRDPAAGGAAHGLSSSQWLCIGFVIVGGVGTDWVHRARERAATA
ncbi:MAG TPA: prolipoprotein diacylglyceryl transferase family protein [Gemmatimonadales bacterium]|jgi:prolipoprotein diacylglyceryl transferase